MSLPMDFYIRVPTCHWCKSRKSDVRYRKFTNINSVVWTIDVCDDCSQKPPGGMFLMIPHEYQLEWPNGRSQGDIVKSIKKAIDRRGRKPYGYEEIIGGSTLVLKIGDRK